MTAAEDGLQPHCRPSLRDESVCHPHLLPKGVGEIFRVLKRNKVSSRKDMFCSKVMSAVKVDVRVPLLRTISIHI